MGFVIFLFHPLCCCLVPDSSTASSIREGGHAQPMYTFLGCFCVSTLLRSLTLLVCCSLLAQEPVWTSWFALSVVVRGSFLYAGGQKLFQGLWEKNREGRYHWPGCQSLWWQSVKENSKGRKAHMNSDTGISFWKHYTFPIPLFIFFFPHGFCEDTIGKISSMVNSAKQ